MMYPQTHFRQRLIIVHTQKAVFPQSPNSLRIHFLLQKKQVSLKVCDYGVIKLTHIFHCQQSHCGYKTQHFANSFHLCHEVKV
jgi:hypothetical protein